MTCLVTGGCGFIGLNLVEHLLAGKRPRIRIMDDLSVGRADALEEVVRELGLEPRGRRAAGAVRFAGPPRGGGEEREVELLVGDIRDPEACAAATQGAEEVMHLAANTGVMPSIQDPMRDAQVNVIGTLNLLRACVANGVRRFVFASSGAPLGEQPPPFHEEQVPRPLSPYGASKLAGEGYCSAFSGSFGLETMILRFSNVYGPRSGHKGSVVARFLRDAAASGRLTIFGDGRQTRDLIYVGDLCRAVVLALDHRRAPGEPACQLFQIGSGLETEVLGVAERVRGLLGGDVSLVFEPARRGEVRRSHADIGRARTILGFGPEVELGDGLERTWEALTRRPTGVAGGMRGEQRVP